MYLAPIVIHGEGGRIDSSAVVIVLTEGGGVVAVTIFTEWRLVEELAPIL